MFQNRNRQRNAGVMLLATQLLSSGPIPPVTLLSILLQIAVFLGFIPKLSLNKTRNMCLLPSRVLAKGEWYRLLAPVIMHGDDMHLYYNMVSLLYKGRKLESRMGSPKFAAVLLIFTVATTLMTVAVSFGLDEIFNAGYMHQCAVGFSGVLFALKVLMNSYFPNENQRLFGWLPIPQRYASWVELILIQVLTPNASFVGHMAGILVGLLYTAGPLKWLTQIISGIIGLAGVARERTTRSHDNYEPTAPPFEDDYGGDYNSYAGNAFAGRGATTGRNDRRYDGYTAGLSEEEQMRRAMEESLHQRHPTNYGWR